MNGNGMPKAIMEHFARNHDNFEGYIFGKSAKKALNDNNNSECSLGLPIFPLNLNSKLLVIAGVLQPLPFGPLPI
jgi:hypothetical protein